jgi:hypothetical protein
MGAVPLDYARAPLRFLASQAMAQSSIRVHRAHSPIDGMQNFQSRLKTNDRNSRRSLLDAIFARSRLPFLYGMAY